MVSNLSLITKFQPLCKVCLVLFLSTGSPRLHNEVGNVCWKRAKEFRRQDTPEDEASGEEDVHLVGLDAAGVLVWPEGSRVADRESGADLKTKSVLATGVQR